MGIKIGRIAGVIVLLGAAAAFGKFAANTGMFEKKPDAVYLTDNEEKNRIAYQSLDQKEKAVYSALYYGIAQKNELIPLPYEIDGDTYSKVYCLLEKQEGSFFYLGSSYYTAERIAKAQIVYRKNIEGADEKIEKLSQAEIDAVDEITSMSSMQTEYEKVMNINDYIVHNCSYVTGSEMEYSPTAYGCLVEHQANCEGYAKTFNMLANDLGLKSVLITGVTDKGENHAWNQVKIDGEWYNIDVTWADPDENDEVRRAYFLCDDKEFTKTHTADEEFFKPYKCESTKNNYYIKNNILVKTEDEARELIEKKISQNEKTIEMKFSEETLYNEFKKKYITEQAIFDLLTESGMEFTSTMRVSVREGDGDLCMTLLID